CSYLFVFFFFQAEDGIRDFHVTGVQTCALPIYSIPVAKRFDRLTHCDYFQCVKLRLSDRVLLEEMRFNTRDKKVFVRCSVMLMEIGKRRVGKECRTRWWA